jgi:hypothetical protein
MRDRAEDQVEGSSHLARDSVIVGLATVLSRILGFVRDVLIARALGAGPIADAFLVAFRLPNMFRRVLGEGGLNAPFVPVYLGLKAFLLSIGTASDEHGRKKKEKQILFHDFDQLV